MLSSEREKINVLMISIGDSILSTKSCEAYRRQQRYAKSLGHIDMIVFSPKKNNLTLKHAKYLSIYPTKSISIATFVYDAFKIARNIIRSKEISVVTTQDPFGTAVVGYLIKKTYNIPLHIQNHSSFLNNKQWMKEKIILFYIFNKIAHFTIKKADRLRVVNNYEKDKYIDILSINESVIDVAPVPVDVDFWQKSPRLERKNNFVNKYSLDKRKKILSWAGRPVRVKNLPYLFKSVSIINKNIAVDLLIAGDMEKSFWNLDDLEKKYGISPIYLGVLSHEDLKTMYYLTDVYLHTSNYEGFGLVVSDAQACGRAVVSRDTAGTSSIIDNTRSGYLVSGDEVMLSNAVISLLKNKKKLSLMSKYAVTMMKFKFEKIDMESKIINSIFYCSKKYKGTLRIH